VKLVPHTGWMSAEPRTVSLKLDADGVVIPARRALALCTELIPLLARAVEEAELSPETPLTGSMRYIVPQDYHSPERRKFYRSWLMAQALQAAARGVRQSLEIALEYLWKCGLQGRTLTVEQFRAEEAETCRRANRANFPDLLAQVSAGLTTPLRFEAAYMSMQQARNCLEHYNGVVQLSHLDDDADVMTLHLPRIGISAPDRDPPVEEIVMPFQVRGGERLAFEFKTAAYSFKAGEALQLTAEDLNNIAGGCFIFAFELANRLPSPPPRPGAGG